MSSGAGNNPWAWLGLLKWSLSYADGTSNETPSPMSDEDKAFLEKVMKEGIINEGERMQEILKQVTETFTKWKTASWTDTEAEETEDALQELRDVVEQIDYARAFASMKGLNFLIGCVQERQAMPPTTRMLALGIMATMAGNNPPIQKELLELGAIRTLSEVYFIEEEDEANDSSEKIRVRLMQALSAMIRSHDLAEQVFCQTEQAVALIESGLGLEKDISVALRQRSLFFLRALVTSDSADRARVRRFERSVGYALDTFTTPEQDDHLRAVTLGLLQQLLEQKNSVNVVLDRKNTLVARGVERVASLRALTGEEREYASAEVEQWESILVLIARATPDLPGDNAGGTPMMLPPSDSPTLPQ